MWQYKFIAQTTNILVLINCIIIYNAMKVHIMEFTRVPIIKTRLRIRVRNTNLFTIL